MSQITISSKYQVVIPKAERRRIGLRPGQKLTVSTTMAGDIMMSRRLVLDVVAGAGTEAWRDSEFTPDQYLRQLREEWDHESTSA